MPNTEFTTINIEGAIYLSALSYDPPPDPTKSPNEDTPIERDSLLWGKQQSGTQAFNNTAANAMFTAGWSDETVNLVGNSFTDGVSSFRIYVNPLSKEVVFVFKGTNSSTEMLANLNDQDQGAKNYLRVEKLAIAAFAALQENPAYAGYSYFTDGHSLGGGMAQTFALQEQIPGFAQNSLPIAPASQTNASFWNVQQTLPHTFAAYLAAYNKSFQEFNEEGDVATAVYNGTAGESVFSGGVYIATSTVWESSTFTSAELQLIQAIQANGSIPVNDRTISDSSLESLLLQAASEAHLLENVIKNYQGTPTNPIQGTADNSQTWGPMSTYFKYMATPIEPFLHFFNADASSLCAPTTD